MPIVIDVFLCSSPFYRLDILKVFRLLRALRIVKLFKLMRVIRLYRVLRLSDTMILMQSLKVIWTIVSIIMCAAGILDVLEESAQENCNIQCCTDWGDIEKEMEGGATVTYDLVYRPESCDEVCSNTLPDLHCHVARKVPIETTPACTT